MSYDISDPKRLHKIHRTMKGFGEALHYSVFRSELSMKGKAELIAALEELIHHTEDRIMIIDLGPLGDKTENRITFLGNTPKYRKREALIV